MVGVIVVIVVIVVVAGGDEGIGEGGSGGAGVTGDGGGGVGTALDVAWASSGVGVTDVAGVVVEGRVARRRLRRRERGIIVWGSVLVLRRLPGLEVVLWRMWRGTVRSVVDERRDRGVEGLIVCNCVWGMAGRRGERLQVAGRRRIV